jgi:hypothetical protein
VNAGPAVARPAVAWARWCLPSFNPACDPQLKGRFADADNSCCDSLLAEYRRARRKGRQGKDEPLCPWENPTALVQCGDSYGV